MFLKRLELSNVRCFESLSIDFDRDGGNNRKWTVILGENGTGKTTVLRSISLLLAGSDALSDLIGRPSDWVRHGSDEAVLSGTIETQDGEPRDIFLRIGRDDRRAQVIANSLESLAPLNAALAHTHRSYFVAGYGGSRRLNAGGMAVSKGQDQHPRARSVASLFSRDAALHPIEAWAMSLDYRREDDGIDVVGKVLEEFLPEMSFSRIDKESEALLFNTPDGEIPLNQLSDGYQNIAAWVGDLLFQITETFEDYRDPLSARGMLIIDEVALHLHPKWQRRLLNFLDQKFPKMQLVVSTHSPTTAQQSPEGALHYITRDEGGLRITAFKGDPGKLLVHQLLSTEAFGHASDESLEVETLKDRYRELYRKDSKDSSDEEELKRISDQIGQRPPDDREAASYTPEQRAMLDKLATVVRQQQEDDS